MSFLPDQITDFMMLHIYLSLPYQIFICYRSPSILIGHICITEFNNLIEYCLPL